VTGCIDPRLGRGRVQDPAPLVFFFLVLLLLVVQVVGECGGDLVVLNVRRGW